MTEREETAIVLDFLPNGYPFDRRPMHQKTSIAQAIGVKKFTLLELVPRKGVFLQPLAEVYIGDGKRDDIHHINGKITTDKLTGTARQELEHVIKELVEKDESKFVEFFNTAQPMSVRMHSLELIPGFGKKHMNEIIAAREEKPFENFADLRTRVKLIPDPTLVIVRRILSELSGNEKHKLFVDR